jgi:hypothetical protein
MTLTEQAIARILDRGWRDLGEGVFEHPTTEVQINVYEGIGGCLCLRERMHGSAQWGGRSMSWTLEACMRMVRKAASDGLARECMAGWTR